MSTLKIEQVSSQLFAFFSRTSWPIRIESVLNSISLSSEYESILTQISAEFERRPTVREEWMSLAMPTKKGETGDEARYSLIERLRLAGPARARDFLAGSIFRNQMSEFSGRPRVMGSINSPMPTSAIADRVFGAQNEGASHRIELALLLGLFSEWLGLLESKQAALRAQRWLESRVSDWGAIWSRIQSDSRSGEPLPARSIMFTYILLDIGRATLFALQQEVNGIWSQNHDRMFPSFLDRWAESSAFGINSSQLAALWSQSFGFMAGLSTPVRLLSRPWRSQHPQIKAQHKVTVDYLSKREAA